MKTKSVDEQAEKLLPKVEKSALDLVKKHQFIVATNDHVHTEIHIVDVNKIRTSASVFKPGSTERSVNYSVGIRLQGTASNIESEGQYLALYPENQRGLLKQKDIDNRIVEISSTRYITVRFDPDNPDLQAYEIKDFDDDWGNRYQDTPFVVPGSVKPEK